MTSIQTVPVILTVSTTRTVHVPRGIHALAQAMVVEAGRNPDIRVEASYRGVLLCATHGKTVESIVRDYTRACSSARPQIRRPMRRRFAPRMTE